ncbi:hypothetical protein [Streptosporangium sp. NPDC048865]|uniref:hypothetical protein n=1 Tax=Streptosporangium sp. NPDC048865 TaxID=3155766 RepID=UPI00342DCE27
MAKASALVMLASVTVAGCSSNAPTMDRAAMVSERPSEKPSAVEPTKAGGEANPLPTRVANSPDVRKNIVQTKCAAVPGGWGAQGTARNPGKKAVTYKVVVYFTTTKATTLDYAQALVKVPPGETVTWKAKKRFPAEREMLCPMPGISVVS